MAGHTGIYATSAECIAKAGNNYPSTLGTEDRINEFCKQAESFINVQGRQVYAVDATAFAALPATTKGLLADIASNIVGIYLLTMKPSGQDGAMVRLEFEDRINILRDAVLRGLNILKEKEHSKFLLTGIST